MWDQTLRPKLARHHQFRRTRYIGFESRRPRQLFFIQLFTRFASLDDFRQQPEAANRGRSDPNG
jgi:hypothetical protein